MADDLFDKNWNDAKDQVKFNTDRRFDERIIELQKVINRRLSQYNHRYFVIDAANKHKMKSAILQTIDAWRGQSRVLKDQNEYFKKTRIWWNRKKSGVLGEYLFSPLVFHLFLQFIVNGTDDSIQNNLKVKLTLFIEIFIDILSAEIKFERTAPKPIVCGHSLLTKGIFKDCCKRLLELGTYIISDPTDKLHYTQYMNTIWSENKNNANPTKQTTGSYIGCLTQLIQHLNNATDHDIHLNTTKLLNSVNHMSSSSYLTQNESRNDQSSINTNNRENIDYRPIHKQSQHHNESMKCQYHPYRGRVQRQKRLQCNIPSTKNNININLKISNNDNNKSIGCAVRNISVSSPDLRTAEEDNVHHDAKSANHFVDINNGLCLFGFPFNMNHAKKRTHIDFVCIDDICIFKESGYSYNP